MGGGGGGGMGEGFEVSDLQRFRGLHNGPGHKNKPINKCCYYYAYIFCSEIHTECLLDFLPPCRQRAVTQSKGLNSATGGLWETLSAPLQIDSTLARLH